LAWERKEGRRSEAEPRRIEDFSGGLLHTHSVRRPYRERRVGNLWVKETSLSNLFQILAEPSDMRLREEMQNETFRESGLKRSSDEVARIALS